MGQGQGLQGDGRGFQRDVLRKHDFPGDLLPAGRIQFPMARLASLLGILPAQGSQCPLPGTSTHLFADLCLCSPLRQHFLHGGERGHAGADGHDGPVRPGHRGRVSGLWDRGKQCCWAPARYVLSQAFCGPRWEAFLPLVPTLACSSALATLCANLHAPIQSQTRGAGVGEVGGTSP